MKSLTQHIIVCIVVASATTCILLLLSGKLKKDEKPIIDNRPAVEETLPATPEPTYNNSRASYYDRTYCEKYNPSCITASGEVFDDTALTTACADWIKLGAFIKVSYKDNSIIVKCNDRGNFESKGRTLDLSKASFEALAPLSSGVLEVRIEVLE